MWSSDAVRLKHYAKRTKQLPGADSIGTRDLRVIGFNPETDLTKRKRHP